MTLLGEMFYLLSDSFILKLIKKEKKREREGKKKSYVKIGGLRNVLFISITNTGTCFSRRIGLIKSFTTQASSYLFLSLELLSFCNKVDLIPIFGMAVGSRQMKNYFIFQNF